MEMLFDWFNFFKVGLILKDLKIKFRWLNIVLKYYIIVVLFFRLISYGILFKLVISKIFVVWFFIICKVCFILFCYVLFVIIINIINLLIKFWYMCD